MLPATPGARWWHGEINLTPIKSGRKWSHSFNDLCYRLGKRLVGFGTKLVLEKIVGGEWFRSEVSSVLKPLQHYSLVQFCTVTWPHMLSTGPSLCLIWIRSYNNRNPWTILCLWWNIKILFLHPMNLILNYINNICFKNVYLINMWKRF